MNFIASTLVHTYFYADDWVVSSADPGWLQLAFNFLTGMFDMLVLQLNSCKTVGIVCWPCLVVLVRVDKYYNWRMMGVEDF